MTVAAAQARALLAEHGSPLWLADVDRARTRARDFVEAWRAAWPTVEVAYSYKTNRTLAFLRAFDDLGLAPEVVCEAEYGLAREVVGADPATIVVNGPHKPAALLRRAAADGALVIADSRAELATLAAAGVRRVGLRVAFHGFTGAPSRFGIRPGEIVAAARDASALGLRVEALSAHLVSTDLECPGPGPGPGPGTLPPAPAGRRITVSWPKPPSDHADGAAGLARLARELEVRGTAVELLDLGGGLPPAPATAEHAAAVAAALEAGGYRGRLLLEPGRALVSDAVDLVCSVTALKVLADGTRCVVVDAGTNLLPGALWTTLRIDAGARAARDCGDHEARPTLVTGPLCLNVDVLHPAAVLPALAPGDSLLVRDVGAYQQVAATQFGDLRPAVVARRGGQWRPARRRERVDDLVLGESDPMTIEDNHPEETWLTV